MEDERMKTTLQNQRNKQKGEATTRYFELLGASLKLIDTYRCFIADMRLQRLDKGFVGIDELSIALNVFEDAQKAVQIQLHSVLGSDANK